MDTRQEARIERYAGAIAAGLKRTATRALLAGVVLGLIFGLVAGLAIGYSLGSPKTIVIPLEPGVEV
jgi:hypothetical protein